VFDASACVAIYQAPQAAYEVSKLGASTLAMIEHKY
jgi:hypothetical protein